MRAASTYRYRPSPRRDGRAELIVHRLADLPAASGGYRRITLRDPRAALDPEDALERAAGLLRPGGVVVVSPYMLAETPETLERVREYAAWIGLADACVVGRAVVARREE